MEDLTDVTGGPADPSPAPAAPSAPPAPPAPPSAALSGEVHDGPIPSSSSSSAAPKGKFPAWVAVLLFGCLVGLIVLLVIHNRRQAAALGDRGRV